MRITICGHAGLYVEAGDQRILVDPCFSATMLDGVVCYRPGRAFEFDKMPLPTVLIITHGHFDHFYAPSVRMLLRELPVITARDPRVIAQLSEMGFSNVHEFGGWQSIEFGCVSLMTTPSEHEEPEFGFVLREGGGATFWHMADAEVGVEVGERIAAQFGRIDLASAKYQPVVCSSIGYLRNAGAQFSKKEVVTWLEAACVCNPRLVFPYAAGLAFCGRHEWFNRYAFPFSQDDIVRMLQNRLGSGDRAMTVKPGDVIEVEGDRPPVRFRQASPFVREIESAEDRWEPVDATTLAGLASFEDRASLQRRLADFLVTIDTWLGQNVPRSGSVSNLYRVYEIVWQLTVHSGGGERLNYFIDFRSNTFAASTGGHPEANMFTHISGQGLLEVLKGEMPGLLFWLAGDVRSYEKIMGVRDGRFWFPEFTTSPEGFLADPLTMYLRHFGTQSVRPGRPELPDFGSSPSSVDLGDLDVLARKGQNRVMSKKVLLAFLAIKEAERIGLEISDEEIELTSDALRIELGLHDREVTLHWLERQGLSLEAYSAVVRDFATVLKLEKHYGPTLVSMLEAHERVAAARASQ